MTFVSTICLAYNPPLPTIWVQPNVTLATLCYNPNWQKDFLLLFLNVVLSRIILVCV